jgi:hypothetical protein
MDAIRKVCRCDHYELAEAHFFDKLCGIKESERQEMKTIHVGASVAILALVSSMIMWAGCEESTTEVTINITPPSATVSNWPAVITFTASLSGSTATNGGGLFHPLEWQISDPGVGRILQTAGDSAVYEAIAGPGVNTITVRDQAGYEGVASVTHSVH